MPVELHASLAHQFATLLLLALPVACASWTVTHEEVFREPRDFCRDRSQSARRLPTRKFFYLFTCEYCFSHYISAFALLLFRFELVFEGWRGYAIAWLAMVWLSNIYMSLFNRLRLDIKHENVAIAVDQTVLPEGSPQKNK